MGSINISAGNSNFIDATSANGDGIKVESGSELVDAAEIEIKLTASNGNNIISSGNNGIDHGGAQIILLDAKKGINKITTIAKESVSEHKEMTGDGIRIGTAEKGHVLPNGKVILEAQSNIIDAEDAGLNNSGSGQAVIDVSATVGPNIISGAKEAVLLNGAGSIIVKAQQNDNSGISLLTEIGHDDYFNKHTNIFGGGENGIHAAANSNGSFTAIADENNYISGSVNGIWTEESSGNGPTIRIEAGQDNIIGFTGQVSDSDGEILTGVIGQNGINVSSGSVTLIAEDENKINATKFGILTSGVQSNIELNGKTNTIQVINSDIGIGVAAVGVKASNHSTVNIGTNDKYINTTEISTSTVRGNSVGLWADDGSINFIGNELNIKASNNDSEDAYAQAIGIMAGDITYNEGEKNAKISINANKDIRISSASSSTKVDTYGLKITQDSSVDLNSTYGDISITSTSEGAKKDSSTLYGIAIYDRGVVNSEGNSLSINTGIKDSANGLSSYGLLLVGENEPNVKEDFAKAEFSITNDISINAFARGGDNLSSPNPTSGMNVTGNAQALLTSKEGDININAEGGYENAFSSVYGLSAEGKYSSIKLNADKNINITTSGYQSFAVNLNNSSNISLKSTGDTLIYSVAHNISGGASRSARGISNYGSSFSLLSANVNLIAENAGTSAGLYTREEDGKTVVDATSFNLIANSTGESSVNSISYGIYTYNKAEVNIELKQNALISSNRFIYDKEQDSYVYNESNKNEGTGIYSSNAGKTNLTANSIYIYASTDGINAGYFSPVPTLELPTNGEVNLVSDYDNIIQAGRYGIVSAGNEANVVLKASDNNIIKSGVLSKSLFGSSYGIYALNGSLVDLQASNQNEIAGALHAKGQDSKINLSGLEGSYRNKNIIYSNARIKNAGNINDYEGEGGNPDLIVRSALYAEAGAEISLKGAQNYLNTYAVNTADDLERVVWAYDKARISVEGTTFISTDNYYGSFDKNNLNSKDIAIAAGTAVGLTYTDVIKSLSNEDRAQVNITYANSVNDEGDLVYSSITGDVLSAYAGIVNIDTNDVSAGINITGNLLAGNNGILNVDLGKSGILTGRADDYGDAGVNGAEDQGHAQGNIFFNPAFSSDIFKGGAVNLTMGEGSQWNVTGQSWITSIDTGITGSSADDVSALPTIDLTQANNTNNSKAAGLTVYSFNGDSNFKMKLDGNDLNNSNMLYMKHASGNYYIELEDAVSAVSSRYIRH